MPTMRGSRPGKMRMRIPAIRARRGLKLKCTRRILTPGLKKFFKFGKASLQIDSFADDGFEGIAFFCEAFGDGFNGEISRVQGVFDFFPEERGRNGSMWASPERVRGDEGLAFEVLQAVDINPFLPFLGHPL